MMSEFDLGGRDGMCKGKLVLVDLRGCDVQQLPLQSGQLFVVACEGQEYSVIILERSRKCLLV